LKNKAVEPKRITSAGRGEFFPIDEAKLRKPARKTGELRLYLLPGWMKFSEFWRITNF